MILEIVTLWILRSYETLIKTGLNNCSTQTAEVLSQWGAVGRLRTSADQTFYCSLAEWIETSWLDLLTIETWTTMVQTPHPLTLAQRICIDAKACWLMTDIYYDHRHFCSEYFVGISFSKFPLHHEHCSWFAMVETRHFTMTAHLYSDSINFGSVNRNPTTQIVVIFGYTIMGHVHCNVHCNVHCCCHVRCPLWCFQTEGSRKWQPQKIENHLIRSEFGRNKSGILVFPFWVPNLLSSRV